MIIHPNNAPRIGEIKRASRTFISPSIWIAEIPKPVSAAPTNPPINACEELEGMASHQVIKFHTMAASKAAKAVGTVTASSLTTSVPMVVATATPKRNGPIKLVIADMVKATRGDMALEAITVATTLALS